MDNAMVYVVTRRVRPAVRNISGEREVWRWKVLSERLSQRKTIIRLRNSLFMSIYRRPL